MCVSLHAAFVFLYGASSASSGLHYDASCCCIRMHPCVQLCREQSTGVGVCSPRPTGHCEFCKYVPDSPTGCVGLAANGAGPRRCTAGVTPASGDRWTEARHTAPVLCAPAMASDHSQSRNARRYPHWPPTRRPADGQQRAALWERVTGRQRRVPGPDQPRSSRAPTPVLRRRGYPDGAYDAPYGAGVDPERVPRPSLVQLHHGKWLESDAQQHALGDMAWAAAVFPSNPPLRRRGTANISLCDHDPVSPRAARECVHHGLAGKKTI